MKVTFCTYDGYNCINGINAWLLRLLPELRFRGIDIQIIFITWADPDMCTTLPILKQMGFNCLEIPLPHYTERQVIWILKELAKNPPDIFVANYMVPALYASRWLRESGISTIGVLHNDDNEYRAILDEFVFGENPFKLSSVVAVSEVLKKLVAQRKPNKTLLTKIPCGAPVPKGVVEKSGVGLKLVYVGRLSEEQKCISETTKALCRAVKEVPNTEAFIYGSGPAQSSVELIIKEEGSDLPIHLMGRVDSQKIQEHLLKCHVIVLLSDYEGLPVALMEAMACGLVPVCLRIESGIPELVIHNETGLLVDDRGDSFIAAIQKLHREPELWYKLSRGARAKIESEYSHQTCVDLWENHLKNLHAKNILNKKITIPYKLTLPQVNINLSYSDNREPKIHQKIYRKIKTIIGKITKF
ncbi:glycosyltransferase family 4 protein [Pseudanabaena biceps]|nr:glycosyltransferase family 4 protein [Pseudanabaena biceps]